MAKNILLPISLLIILSTSQVDCMDYMNNTIDFAKIVDDFSFHQPIKGQRNERNGRRLISFDTRNDNIEVGLEFGIPFLSIPVKRSVNSMKSWASQTVSYVTDPVMNINGGAIGLTVTVALAGLATTLIWRALMKEQVAHFNRGHNGANKRADEHSVFPFIDVMEQILHKYDIDAIGCMQTVLCTFAQHAMENVGKGNGTNAEKIFDGAARTWLLKEISAGTAIYDAIIAGHQSIECRKRFSTCQIKPKQIHKAIESLLQHIKLNYT